MFTRSIIARAYLRRSLASLLGLLSLLNVLKVSQSQMNVRLSSVYCSEKVGPNLNFGFALLTFVQSPFLSKRLQISALRTVSEKHEVGLSTGSGVYVNVSPVG